MRWYVAALRKYSIINGRSRRTEFWMFTLFNLLISIGLSIVEFSSGFGGLVLVYGLAVLVPCFTLTIRRLHDTNRSGWWILSGLIPVIGWLALLILMSLEGKHERNQFGPDPKRLGAEI